MQKVERKREPWPFVVAGLLIFMISTSLTFLGVAIRHPDPPVIDDAYRAGLEYVERMLPAASPVRDE